MSDTSTSSIAPRPGTLRIYGCGGAGVNLASHFENAAGRPAAGMAVTYPAYIDTSRANLKGVSNEDYLYLVEDTDGAGADRRLIHEKVAPRVKEMLAKFEPMDLNVVCFSAGGGSGSVIGPLLMAELNRRNASVVGLVVGSHDSFKAVENTLNTMRSLESLAERGEAAITIRYCHNDEDTPESVVDTDLRHSIAALAILASRQNDRLDSADIRHWLRFEKSTQVRPRVAALDIVRSNDELDADGQYIAAVSLYETADSSASQSQVAPALPAILRPEYHATGFFPKNAEIKGPPLFHFATRIDLIGKIFKTLSARHEQMRQEIDARVVSSRLTQGAEANSDDGLFL